MQREIRSDLAVNNRVERPTAASPFVRNHPEFWVAVILWLASNLFVASFSHFANWEGAGTYNGVGDLCKWDCPWYGSVVVNGYDRAPHSVAPGEANWPFHPLFPMSVYPIHYWLGFPLHRSLVLGSKLALLLAIYGFLLMVRDGTESTADRFRAGSLVALNPYLIYAHAGYAEPLYFGLLALAFYFAARRRWIAAGATGALVSASRVVGVVFAISYAVMVARDAGWRASWRKIRLNQFLGFMLCPLGTAVYMLYLHRRTGDALAQVHVQVAWGKMPGNPINVVWQCLSGGHWLPIWGLMAIASGVASIWLFQLRKPELGIYLALSILIPMSAGYWGIARYVWWQPPFLYAVCTALKRNAAWWTIYTGFTAGMASFVIWAWLGGRDFVI